MKQLAIISGKGGTGKTVITSAFASIADNKVIVDCDVDAANLHLMLNPKILEHNIFKSGFTASIDRSKCTRCLKCLKNCRFNAITKNLTIDSIACEGCAFCYNLCPVGAITLEENIAGEWFISETKYGPFVHAKLGIAEENSGKLVSLIRKQAQTLAKEQNKNLIIIDGPPGIGCQVIATLANIDSALIVTEPTVSGLHDAKRVIELAKHFTIPIMMLINKYDLNLAMTKNIEQYCEQQNIILVGKIKFDTDIVNAVTNKKPIMNIANIKLKEQIQKIWHTTYNNL
ncbi:MAG: ATP-binding protein [Gammaproteobacteria bacterium]|nr:ATP-binding protein [Gammaproteobacteria bacterium]